MSLKHALLGFINYGPMTGYEIKKFFDTSVAHFWNAELSQIYPALKTMQSEGLVEMRVEVQDDKPNRKVYSITDRGQLELRQWLAQPAEPEQIREPLLIKVFFGATLPKEDLLRILQTHIDQHRQYLQQLELGGSMISKFAAAIGLPRDATFWGLTIDAGLRVCRAEMEWAEAAIAKLGQLNASSLAGGSPDWQAMNVHSATDILERLKKAAPELFTISHSGASERAASVATNERTGNDHR